MKIEEQVLSIDQMNHLKELGVEDTVKKHLIYGVGCNDTKEAIINRKATDLYSTWFDMLTRCYNIKYQEKYPTYKGCSVCDEWKTLSAFKKWYDKNHVVGWDLDKDIISYGNKIYCPQYCSFVPKEINYLFLHPKKDRELPIGVYKVKGTNKYQSQINEMGRRIYLGSFNTKEEAYNEYLNKKRNLSMQLAIKYKGNLDPRVFNQLIFFYENGYLNKE